MILDNIIGLITLAKGYKAMFKCLFCWVDESCTLILASFGAQEKRNLINIQRLDLTSFILNNTRCDYYLAMRNNIKTRKLK